jgi:sensor domain CHASE-containing protein
MAEVFPTVVTAAVGVVLLVVLVLIAWAPVRRFARAEAALRSSVAEQVAQLRALGVARRHRTGR